MAQAILSRMHSLIANASRSNRGWGALIFHHISEHEDALTAGLNVTYDTGHFAEKLEYLSKIYRFIRLDELDDETVVTGKRPLLLLTFDDAYRSVREAAAPICKELGIPAVFFVNAGFLDNRVLALDNLLTYIVNTIGMEPIVKITGGQHKSLHDVIGKHVANLGPTARRAFAASLIESTGLDSSTILARHSPYLSSVQLGELLQFDFEIGSHTLTHAHLRSLCKDELHNEIVTNKERLEKTTGQVVRAFAFPDGHKNDATSSAVEAIKTSGHTRAFLVHRRLNMDKSNRYCATRIGLRTSMNLMTVLELEIAPRLRHLADCARGRPLLVPTD